jgi:tetratricopeptide (TPR) repeat protein
VVFETSVDHVLRATISSAFLCAAIATVWHATRDPAISPRSSAPLIDRGLAAERAGDLASAERDLLEAARLDHLYLPAWTLANFYFRRHDADRFWPWACRAAALVYDDPAPLLQLADRMDPGHAAGRLGDSPKLARVYLDVLIREANFDEATAVARKMLLRNDREDRPRLRAFTTHLIAANRHADALEIWNNLGESEASLHHSPSGEGFDWRLPPSPGISSLWRTGTLDFAFDGGEPDTSPLVDRVIATDPRARRLAFEYSTDLPGLRWALDNIESPELIASSPWRDAEWTLPLHAAPFGRLVLFYRRDVGVPRAEGRLQIRNIRVVNPSY